MSCGTFRVDVIPDLIRSVVVPETETIALMLFENGVFHVRNTCGRLS
jgi:hypothetical protein